MNKLEERLNQGENLRDILESLKPAEDARLSRIGLFPETIIEASRLPGIMDEMISLLNKQGLGSTISKEMIEIESISRVPFASYIPGVNSGIYRDIAELMLNDFYKWSFGIEISDKPELFVKIKKPAFGGKSDIYLKMPLIAVPSSEEEIAMSIGDECILNIFGLLGDDYGFKVKAIGREFQLRKTIPHHGIVKWFPRNGCGREGHVLLSSQLPMHLLESIATEHLHYMIGDITNSHTMNDPRQDNPRLMKIDDASEEELEAMIHEWHEQRKKDPALCLSQVKYEWMAIEEGFVHGASLNWMRHLNDKYNLHLNESNFRKRMEQYNSAWDNAPIDYSKVSIFHDEIRNRGVRAAFQDYLNNPEAIFRKCYVN